MGHSVREKERIEEIDRPRCKNSLGRIVWVDLQPSLGWNARSGSMRRGLFRKSRDRRRRRVEFSPRRDSPRAIRDSRQNSAQGSICDLTRCVAQTGREDSQAYMYLRANATLILRKLFSYRRNSASNSATNFLTHFRQRARCLPWWKQRAAKEFKISNNKFPPNSSLWVSCDFRKGVIRHSKLFVFTRVKKQFSNCVSSYDVCSII